MKRLCCLLLCLALCCVLFACVKPVPNEPAAEETTTAVLPGETTAALVPESGDGHGLRLRTLNLNDAENAEIKRWLVEWEEERYNREWPTQFPMGNGKTVLDGRNIVLRENGKETVLLEPRYLGEDDPETDEVAWIYPSVLEVIDERYFAFHWGGWEWIAGTSVYDTQEMREITIQWDEKTDYEYPIPIRHIAVYGDGFYLVDAAHGPYGGPLHLMRADLTQLGTLQPDEGLKAVNLLDGIPHAPASEVSDYELTSDGRWHIVTDRDGLYLFDLQAKVLTYQPKTGLGVQIKEDWEHVYFSHIAVRDEHTLYCFGLIDNDLFESYALEITLP